MVKIVKLNLEWARPLVPLNLDKVLFLVIHHPAALIASGETIHQWHLDRFDMVNGEKVYWKGAAYNEYIRKDGTVEIMRGDNIGGHCKNLNSKSYGICCEGNYTLEKEMPEAQLNALIERVKFHRSRFKNLVEVGPHNRYVKTDCPGQHFPMAQLYTALGEETILQQMYSAIELLNHCEPQIINSPEFWTVNAVKGKTVPGEYAQALILKTAKYVNR